MDADLTWFELLRNAIDALKANAPAASVVIAVLAFLVSLATYRRAWRWRSEAEPAFVQVQGDMLLFPEFKRAGVDPVFIGWLANCGDGRAFNVKAIGINCDTKSEATEMANANDDKTRCQSITSPPKGRGQGAHRC